MGRHRKLRKDLAITKRANGEGTAYQRQDGRWCAQIVVTTPEGRRKRKTVYGKTQREVLARKRDIESAQAAGRPVTTAQAPTIKAYGEVWLTQTLRSRVELGDLAPATWRQYRDIWVVHIAPDLGHHRLDALTPPLIRSWLGDKRVSPSSHGRPLSPRTVQLLHATLRKAYNDAVRDGLLAHNPVLSVAGPPVRRRRGRFLTRDEARLLMTVIRGDELEALWALLLGSGLRIGEALALHWADLYLDASRLTVRGAVGDLPGPMTMERSGRRRGLRAAKTASSHASVPLPAFVVDALRKQRLSVTEQRLAAHAWSHEDLVFPSAIGTVLDPANVARRWRALRVRAGLPDVRVHDLRHSTATFLLAAGVPMKAVQEILRHSRLGTTADLYTHVLPEVASDAAARLNSYLTSDG